MSVRVILQSTTYCPEMGRTIPIPDNRPLNQELS